MQWSKENKTNRLSIIKRKQNKKIINDLKETEHKDYQWSKKSEHKDYQWSKGNRKTKTVIDQKETEHKEFDHC
jgi:hypothetical protein